MSETPATAEEAVELFLARRQRGEAVDTKAFAALHPSLAPELESALDALIALERATVETDPEPLPEHIGPFRVIRELGRGGMGVVLEAVEEPLNRRVALKVLPPELLSSPSARARFRREAELAARLDHSGIATIYGAGVENDRPWIAMRYVEGRTLARAIADTRRDARAGGASCVRLASTGARGREAALLVASLLSKVARALHSAHEQGVLHRDIKPSNIIVAPDGSPVLLDFGLAIAEVSDGRSLTSTGEAPGTPAYLTPESVSGELPRPDVQSDVYALGVTLYECLALRRPFDAPTPAALYHAILTGAPAGVRVLNTSVSRDLAVVTATAMERDRGRRYRSASALADDLEACVAGRPIAARPVPLYGRVLRWARREPRLALAIAAAIVIAIGGLAWVSIVQTAAGRAVAEKNKELSATNVSLATAKAKAEANEHVATQKADDVLSLSAIQNLQDLVDRADQLWPADPENIAKYEEWLRDARALLEGRPADPARGIKARPGLAEHEQKLAELEARALPWSEEEKARQRASHPGATELASRHEWAFADGEDRWWHVQLVKLIADLQAFSDPKAGLFSPGISKEHGWGVERRLDFARTIEERSVSGPEALKRWAEAIASIRDTARSPMYDGLVIAPQPGLLPIGRDPDSGLWEFAHLEIGEPAERGPDGKLVLKEETGIIFVLIPGGTFKMGAQNTDPSGPNYDPQCSDREMPVHEITLSPFFLSKYEMTQGQWMRFTGSNPSYYAVGSRNARTVFTALHPVEQVSWLDCSQIVSRLALVLPTEAQWEYACRSKTHTSWCTGDTVATLAGHANIADEGSKDAYSPSWQYEAGFADGFVLHAPIGRFEPNAWGLHDMHGNVWEWCRDAYASYSSPVKQEDGEREVPGPRRRMVRGGCFGTTAIYARSASRDVFSPEFRSYDLGLRPARAITSP